MLRTAKQLQTDEDAFQPCPQDKKAVRAWIEAAKEKSKDADNATVSLGTRFEAAYDAAFTVALAVLNAAGWRHRAVNGHHSFVLEAACAAAGASDATFDRLDAIRDIRNQKYTGVSRTEADLQDAKDGFEEFSKVAVAWLQAEHGNLLK
jgi:acyl transferase domain-containing protein